MNDLLILLALYPNEQWDWDWISANPLIYPKNLDKIEIRSKFLIKNPNITWNFIQNHPEIDWNKEDFRYNPNLTWEIITQNDHINWDYNYLSSHPNITWEIISQNLSLPWGAYNVCFNPNITWEIVKAHPFNWNFKVLCATVDYSLIEPKDYIFISSNPKLTWEEVKNNLDKNWSWETLSTREFITPEIVNNHPDLPWDDYFLYLNPNFPWDWKGKEDLNMEAVSNNPNLNWKVIRDHKLAWNFTLLSRNTFGGKYYNFSLELEIFYDYWYPKELEQYKALKSLSLLPLDLLAIIMDYLV